MGEYTSDSFRCGLCSAEFDNIENYASHMLLLEHCVMVLSPWKDQHDLLLPRFQRCSVPAGGAAVQVVTGVGSARWKCRVCGITFSRQAAYHNHYNLAHSSSHDSPADSKSNSKHTKQLVTKKTETGSKLRKLKLEQLDAPDTRSVTHINDNINTTPIKENDSSMDKAQSCEPNADTADSHSSFTDSANKALNRSEKCVFSDSAELVYELVDSVTSKRQLEDDPSPPHSISSKRRLVESSLNTDTSSQLESPPSPARALVAQRPEGKPLVVSSASSLRLLQEPVSLTVSGLSGDPSSDARGCSRHTVSVSAVRDSLHEDDVVDLSQEDDLHHYDEIDIVSVYETGALSCHMCSQTFKTPRTLQQHCSIVHASLRPFVCDWKACGQSFKTKGSLTRHTRRHTDERPFQCMVCGRSFRESGTLQRHHQSKVSCAGKSDWQLTRYRASLPLQPPPDCKASLPQLLKKEELHAGEEAVTVPCSDTADEAVDCPSPHHGVVAPSSPQPQDLSTSTTATGRVIKQERDRDVKVNTGVMRHTTHHHQQQQTLSPPHQQRQQQQQQQQQQQPLQDEDHDGHQLQLDEDHQQQQQQLLTVAEHPARPSSQVQTLISIKQEAGGRLLLQPLTLRCKTECPEAYLSQSPRPLSEDEDQYLEEPESPTYSGDNAPDSSPSSVVSLNPSLIDVPVGVGVGGGCGGGSERSWDGGQEYPELEDQPSLSDSRDVKPRLAPAPDVKPRISAADVKPRLTAAAADNNKTTSNNVVTGGGGGSCSNTVAGGSAAAGCSNSSNSVAVGNGSSSNIVAGAGDGGDGKISSNTVAGGDGGVGGSSSSMAGEPLECVFVCPHCDRSFKSRSALMKHLYTHIDKLGPHCTECNKTFSSRDGVVRHVVRHSSVRRFVCCRCGAHYSHPSKLQQHLLSHSEHKAVLCQLCGRAFKTVSSRNLHARSHTGAREVCAVCGRQFTTRGSLQRHARTHSGERPYCCTHCNQAFRDQGTLARHLRHKKPCCFLSKESQPADPSHEQQAIEVHEDQHLPDDHEASHPPPAPEQLHDRQQQQQHPQTSVWQVPATQPSAVSVVEDLRNNPHSFEISLPIIEEEHEMLEETHSIPGPLAPELNGYHQQDEPRQHLPPELSLAGLHHFPKMYYLVNNSIGNSNLQRRDSNTIASLCSDRRCLTDDQAAAGGSSLDCTAITVHGLAQPLEQGYVADSHQKPQQHVADTVVMEPSIRDEALVYVQESQDCELNSQHQREEVYVPALNKSNKVFSVRRLPY